MNESERVRRRLPRWAAALVGVLGMASALAAGELVAGFVGAQATPFLAVGNTVIDHVPSWLEQFAVRTFGTNDKMALLSGMALVLLILAVAAGLLSRRSALPGTVVAIALGVVGIAAVFSRADLGQLAVLAPFASLVAGAVVFRWLHALAWRYTADAERDTAPAAESAPTRPAAEAGQPARREFLVAAGAVAIGAGVAGGGGWALAAANDVESSRQAVGTLVPATPAPAIPAGADFAAAGTPSFITSNADFYRIDTAFTVPQISTTDWRLRVHGLVDREVTFSYSDIRDRPLVELPITLCCVSNPVGGPYISTANFIGVPLRDLLLEAGVAPEADQLLSTSADNFTAGTPVQAVLDPNRGALLAIGMNRQPLPVEHGFPARLVVPGLYGYVSATKWVVDLELTTFAAKQAYWVPRGYSAQAPVKTESRIDVPVSGSTVPAGQVVVAGIAFAQTKGIAKVEVRVDGGPWQPARLSTEVSKNTWRMWRTELRLGPGNHTVEARATDDTGYTQTGVQVDEIPDGATGWPSVSVTAT